MALSLGGNNVVSSVTGSLFHQTGIAQVLFWLSMTPLKQNSCDPVASVPCLNRSVSSSLSHTLVKAFFVQNWPHVVYSAPFDGLVCVTPPFLVCPLTKPNGTDFQISVFAILNAVFCYQ